MRRCRRLSSTVLPRYTGEPVKAMPTTAPASHYPHIAPPPLGFGMKLDRHASQPPCPEFRSATAVAGIGGRSASKVNASRPDCMRSPPPG